MPTTPVYALPYPAAADPADVPLDMQELADRLEVVLPTIIALEAWHLVGAAGEPAFQNGWINYAGYPAAAFYKDPLGIVHLKGVIRNGTLNQAAFTLPVGYRSSDNEAHFPAPSASAFGQVNITSTGGVVPSIGNAAGGFDLFAVSFRAG